ncbi:MAG: hypothetical protein PVG65_01565 [Candidatus Thorarchaeota archaeon]|jgi:hypothetical protein
MPENNKKPEESAAVFNMALATLQRLDIMLREIKLISIGNSMDAYGFQMSPGVAQHTKYKLVKQLFVQSIPLFNPKKKEEQKKEVQKMIDMINLLYIKNVDRLGRLTSVVEGFNEIIEKQLDEIIIRIEEILQEEQYFMPPKSSPKYGWKES